MWDNGLTLNYKAIIGWYRFMLPYSTNFSRMETVINCATQRRISGIIALVPLRNWQRPPVPTHLQYIYKENNWWLDCRVLETRGISKNTGRNTRGPWSSSTRGSPEGPLSSTREYRLQRLRSLEEAYCVPDKGKKTRILNLKWTRNQSRAQVSGLTSSK